MRRWYHTAARRELNESVLWYEDQKPGLGARFFTAVQETIAHIMENPRRFPVVYRDLQASEIWNERRDQV